jgi:hypothetical protein
MKCFQDFDPSAKRLCSIEPFTMMALGGAAGGVGSSIFSGIFGKKGAKEREKAIIQGRDRAEGWLQSFRERGDTAQTLIMDMLSGKVDPDAMVKESSMFNFQSEIGSRNINRELKARGLYGSGAGLKTLQQFNNQLVAEEGQRTFDRLFKVADQGMNAAGTLANVDMQAAGAIGASRNAQQRSIGDMGAGIFDAVGGGVQNYYGMEMLSPMLKRLGGGAGPTPLGGLSAGDEQEALGRGIVAGTAMPGGTSRIPIGDSTGVTWASTF